MGCRYMYSQGSNQNGWFDEADDLKEEDVWGGHDAGEQWNIPYSGSGGEFNEYTRAMENGHTSSKGKAIKSKLSMELKAVDGKGYKKGLSGLGFADLDVVQNGGYGASGDGNGGWAPGFSVRKVKIPVMGGGDGNSGLVHGWHDPTDGRWNRGVGVPQSAPVTMPVWPAKCGFGDSEDYVAAEDSSPRGGGDDDDQDIEYSEGDDDGVNTERRRLAPHEIVDREYARSHTTTFSVIEGAGRTLKGSDLRRVRNAVWSCTGFED